MRLRRKRTRWAILAAATLLTVGSSACSGGNQETTSAGRTDNAKSSTSSPTAPSTPLSAGGTAEFHGAKDVGDASSIEVEMGENYFAPTVIRGAPGREITLELKNSGLAFHNFALVEQGVDVDVPSGESAEVTVKIPASGAIAFDCKYHTALNMRGELQAAP